MRHRAWARGKTKANWRMPFQIGLTRLRADDLAAGRDSHVESAGVTAVGTTPCVCIPVEAGQIPARGASISQWTVLATPCVSPQPQRKPVV